jgi:hypothetical protein
MPTDGADFGRIKACYGKVYTALRAGADDADVAELAVRGVERDIRRDGGAPAFGPAVQLAVLISCQASSSSSQQLVRNIDDLARLHSESSLTRHVLSAAEKVALAARSEGVSLSRLQASERIIAQMARGRCEGMSGYAMRHRTHSLTATESLIGSVSDKLLSAPSCGDLATRMLNANAKGLPAKPARAPRIDHSAESLNNTSLEGGL